MLSGVVSFIIAITGVIAGILALLSDELKKNKRLKYILVAVLLAFSVYSMLGSLLAFSNGSTSKTGDRQFEIPIAVDSNKYWQTSGINVKKGDTVSIKVVGGKWTTGRFELSPGDKKNLPDSYKNLQTLINIQYEQAGQGLYVTCVDSQVKNCPIPEAPWGALVARIDDGVPVLIGKTNSFVAADSGTIFFAINDDLNFLDENFGVLATEISVK
jgi:hypothetical protein